MTNSLLRRTVAEFIGTYALIVAGCGAIMVNALNGELGHIGIALTFGLIIAVMIAATGHICMAHFNPAVTLAFALTGHFSWRDVAAYLGAQFMAACLGAATLRLILGDVAQLGATVPTLDIMPTLLLEIFLTACLMLVITAVATDSRAQGVPAGLAIGLTVMVGALWAGPLTGASMNPARSFGPALLSGTWDIHWVYWVGPIVGAALGATLYQFIRVDSSK
jgi:MIP family channel proteins